MIWFNCLVLVLSLNVSIDIYPFRNPAKEEIDKDGKIDRGNLNETDEIEVAGKGYSYCQALGFAPHLILLHMCPHTPRYVSSYLLHMCPHTTTYVSSY